MKSRHMKTGFLDTVEIILVAALTAVFTFGLLREFPASPPPVVCAECHESLEEVINAK